MSTETIMDPREAFELEKREAIREMAADEEFRALSYQWAIASAKHRYTYNFTWLGRPFIQFPQDMMAMQEVIWKARPDLIVETGIAHGGSLIFYASMLELLGGDGRVVGVDIDIRPHNREEIEKHPLFRRIDLIQGSSTDGETVRQVRDLAEESRRVLLVLDSNHTHEHVLAELELYSPLVGQGSYIVVFDTFIEDMPEDSFPDRPWSKGNNPKTAVWEFLERNDRFVIDKEIEEKLMITVAPDGYLRCIKD